MDGNKNDETIGQRIGRLRTERNESQEALANAIGEARETIKHWENGTRRIKAEAIIKLAQYFGVASDYLLGLSDIKSANGDIQTACKYTGLSEEAIIWLYEHKDRHMTAPDDGIQTPHDILDSLLKSSFSCGDFEEILIDVCFAAHYADEAKRYIDSDDSCYSESEMNAAYDILHKMGETCISYSYAAENLLSSASSGFYRMLTEKITEPMRKYINERTPVLTEEERAAMIERLKNREKPADS